MLLRSMRAAVRGAILCCEPPADRQCIICGAIWELHRDQAQCCASGLTSPALVYTPSANGAGTHQQSPSLGGALMQQGNGQFVLPYTAHQVAASSGEMHLQEMGTPAGLLQDMFARQRCFVGNTVCALRCDAMLARPSKPRCGGPSRLHVQMQGMMMAAEWQARPQGEAPWTRCGSLCASW